MTHCRVHRQETVGNFAQYWDVVFVFRGRAAPEFPSIRQADGRTDPSSDPYRGTVQCAICTGGLKTLRDSFSKGP